jgi:LmbE family N-acetylglucosaminyl deacetylase
MRYLVVAAHPDDEVLGCGGTIARLSSEGHEVYIGILGEGITSRYAQPDQADRHLVESLGQASHRVAKMMGAKDLFMYDLPDNRFDTVPMLDVVKVVEDLVRKVSPDTIYTHHGSDLNVDHVVTNRAVLTATRPGTGNRIADILAFEVPSSTEWSFGKLQSTFQPNFFVDIAKTLQVKIHAMATYESEARPFPHPRSPRALTAIAERWGSVIGVEAAEAFELVRSIR